VLRASRYVILSSCGSNIDWSDSNWYVGLHTSTGKIQFNGDPVTGANSHARWLEVNQGLDQAIVGIDSIYRTPEQLWSKADGPI
jgi:hypothetical protein